MKLQTRTNNNNVSNADPPLFDDIDSSNCSTPYVSAPSSPGRSPIAAASSACGGFFYSAPSSPMHFTITAATTYSPSSSSGSALNVSSSEFEFSARFGSTGFNASGSMCSADELFLNGQIRPMKLSTHLERPQVLAPLLDLEEEEEEQNEVVRGRDLRLRDKSLRRRTRSLSPLRNTPLEWTENEDVVNEEKTDKKKNVTPSVSSGNGRSSKRWVFLKDFLRSKSEGRSNNKFWSTISFSPTKDKKAQNHVNGPEKVKKVSGKPTNGVGKRRVLASAHELHYKANRAQAEELRRKTFLPYRQGLLGCLGFSSKGYGAMSGFARALNPVSSRLDGQVCPLSTCM